MRSFSLAAPACLAAALLLGATASRAQTPSGWVDPPAKAETKGGAGRDVPKPAKPAKVEAQAPEPKLSEPARKTAEMPAAQTSRPDAAEGRHARRRHHADRAQRRERRLSASSEIDAGGARAPMVFTPDSRVPDQADRDLAGRAQRLAGDYLDVVSAPNAAMLSASPRFYGERVRFHGRSMSTAALIAEKRRFVRRWPERRYEAQDGTMRTACNTASATCTVRTVMGFRAENPARGARSQGLSELTLTVSFSGERPVIVTETSRVLRRGSPVLGAAGHLDDGGA